MKQLTIASVAMVLMIWIWAEYFRAIPNLEQAGVLKNFQIERVKPMTGTFTVLAKEYYSPRRHVLHPASPMVGSFSDLAYLSNMDFLLATEKLNLKQLASAFKVRQEQRCYQLRAKNQAGQTQEDMIPELINLSVIASTEQVANQLRQVKAGQKIYLKGEWVQVQSVENATRSYGIGLEAVKQGKICGIFRVDQLQNMS